jgi:hypothetical protein
MLEWIAFNTKRKFDNPIDGSYLQTKNQLAAIFTRIEPCTSCRGSKKQPNYLNQYRHPDAGQHLLEPGLEAPSLDHSESAHELPSDHQKKCEGR